MLRTFIIGLLTIISNYGIGQWNQLGEDIYGVEPGDWCGHGSVINANGNRIAVGSVYNDESGEDSGHVRVFDFDGIGWNQVGDNILGEHEFDVSGHMWSLAFDSTGNTLAIGSPLNDDGEEDAGHIRVYQLDESEWVQMGSDIDGLGIDWTFGNSISLSNNGLILAIGCSSFDSDFGEENIGTVFLYEFDGEEWIQIGTEVIGDNPGDGFGAKVSLNSDGSIFAASSYLCDEAGTNTGEIKVYQFDGMEWLQVGDDIQGADIEDRLGGSGVCLSEDGSILSAASYSSGTGGYNRGKVQVFEFNGEMWVQMGEDVYGDNNSDFLGISLDMSADGSTFIAGAYGNDFAGSIAGQAKVYKYYGGNWNLVYSPIYGLMEEERFGNSSSINATGNRVVIGGHTSDMGSEEAGVVRVYESEACLGSVSELWDTVCYSYTVPSGDEVYEISGIYSDTIFNSCGNDSIITINLIVNETTYENLSVIECAFYTSPSGDSTYWESTDVIDTISNVHGCDSILFIEVIIGNNTGELSVFACDSFVVPSGDEVYFESGIYMDTIPNIVGCDSVLTINLTIDNSESFLATEACAEYTVPSGDETYYESGVYTDTLPSVLGCDSIITIDLTIHSLEAEINYSEGVLTAGPDLALYEWVHCQGDGFETIPGEIEQTFYPSEDGGYAVIVTDEHCADTSECIEFRTSTVLEQFFPRILGIYLNPTNENVSVLFHEELFGQFSLMVYNQMGQEVLRLDDVQGNEVFIKKSLLGSGVYFMQLCHKDIQKSVMLRTKLVII